MKVFEIWNPRLERSENHWPEAGKDLHCWPIYISHQWAYFSYLAVYTLLNLLILICWFPTTLSSSWKIDTVNWWEFSCNAILPTFSIMHCNKWCQNKHQPSTSSYSWAAWVPAARPVTIVVSPHNVWWPALGPAPSKLWRYPATVSLVYNTIVCPVAHTGRSLDAGPSEQPNMPMQKDLQPTQCTDSTPTALSEGEEPTSGSVGGGEGGFPGTEEAVNRGS